MPVQKNHLDVDILSVFVKKVFQKVRHRLIGDMSADDNVPAKKYSVTCKFRISQNNLTMSVLHARSGGADIDLPKEKTKPGLFDFCKRKNLVNVEPGET